MYRDAMARAEPWRLTGVNALDARRGLYGLPAAGSGASAGAINPFDLSGYGSGSASPASSSGSTQDGAYGTSGTGSMKGFVYGMTGKDPSLINALETGNLGKWAAQGGPSALSRFLPTARGGSVLDPLNIFGGDQSRITPVNQAVDPSMDWKAYLEGSPDLQAEWAKNEKLRTMFSNDPNQYAAYHYENFGKNENRQLNQVPNAGNTQSNMPVGGTQLEGQGAGATNPLDAYGQFLASAHNRAASEVNDVDFEKIKGQLGAAGKSISGPGEARYAKTLAGNRFNALQAYDAGLAGISGTGFDAVNNLNAQGYNTAGQVGTSNQNAADSRGAGYAAKMGGYADGISGAIDAFSAYNKNKPAKKGFST